MTPTHARRVLPCLLVWPQECELQLTRDQDERDYSLLLGSRVFVTVKRKSMMAFDPKEIDSTPIV